MCTLPITMPHTHDLDRPSVCRFPQMKPEPESETNSIILNKRGDKRGTNGRSAKRGPGGKFSSGSGGSSKKKKVAEVQFVPPQPCFEPLRPVQGLSAALPPSGAPIPMASMMPQRKLRVVSNLVNYNESIEEDFTEMMSPTRLHAVVPSNVSGAAALAPVPAAAPAPPVVLAPVVLAPVEVTPVAVMLVVAPAPAPIAATTTAQVALDTPVYLTATSASELARIVAEGTFKPAQTTIAQKDYLKFITYQCALDRRDNGSILPHVVEIDTFLPPMDRFRTFDTTSQLEIVGITTDAVARSTLAGIFVQRQLLVGTIEEIEHDMNIFSQSPFNMIVVKRGDVIEGGAVFRAHTLNTGERVIHIELIATAINATRGGGSALMRVMRKLSQVSALHNGHMVALTLKNKATGRFYQRKLPEHGPQARAIMISIALLDENTILKRNLDIRYTTVFAV